MSSTGTVYYQWNVEQSPQQRAFNGYMLIAGVFLNRIGHRMGLWLPVIDRNFINDPETTNPDSLTIITVETRCTVCDRAFRCVMEKISYFSIRGETTWGQVIGHPRSFLFVTSFEPAELSKVEAGGRQSFETDYNPDFMCSRFKNLA